MNHIASPRIRVVIVDDSRTMRAVLEQMLSTRLNYQIVGIAGDGKAAITMIERLRPDLVTIDLAMPYIDGKQLLQGLEALPMLRKVVISGSVCDNLAMKASLERMGADACLCKTEILRDPDGFCRTLSAVMRAPRTIRATVPVPVPAAVTPPVAAGGSPAAPVRYPIPADERERLAALAEGGLANDDADHRLDLLTGHLVQTTSFSASVITVIDSRRLWIKSGCGIERGSVDRAQAICNHTICGDEPFIVSDTLSDTRLAGLDVVRSGPMIRAYAGFPVVGAAGVRLGAICLLDTVPRRVTVAELTNLRSIARMAADVLDGRPATAAQCVA